MTQANNPTKSVIRKQVARIVNCNVFRGSEKQRKFLMYIVAESLAGREDKLKGYTIAIDVYGRKDGFDPQSDPIVRVEAGRLRRALAYYYLTDGKDDPILIEIPKGAYKPTFQLRQPQGREGEKPLSAQGVHPYTAPSIAVLPLVNLTGNEEDDYFSDGLAEELTTELARYQDLLVIAFQSTLRYKSLKTDPKTIGDDLGVRFLLTGSIRKDTETIKVTINLLDTSSSTQIWGRGYKRNLAPVKLIALQEEIAHSVVGVVADNYGLLTRRLSKEVPKKAPSELQAYDAILRFYHYESVLTSGTFQQAFTALKKAVEINPEYGLAWAVLGHLYADNYALGFCNLENPLEKALECALKGLILEPESQFVHDALTLVHFHRGDKASFISHLDKTITLNPNAPYIIGVAGWHLSMFGEWDRGLSLLKKGMQLNPYHPTWFYLATFLDCYNRGDYASAYTEALKFNYPELFWDPLVRVISLAQLGDDHEAQKALKELFTIVPNFESMGRLLIGNYVKAPELLESLIGGLQKAGLTNLP
jgi:adenylate cyclase